MLAIVRSALARRLEVGASLSSPVARALAHIHAPLAARAIVRPLDAPEGVTIVSVGGATLGGSGKTRVALACARALARRGVDVTLVGHAYRARPMRPRVVRPDDALADVGDEALACARALAAFASGRVVVAPSRQAAVDHAASLGARVVVLDGVLQTRPARSALALLAVDAHMPWGARAVAPSGDLRAPIDALVGASDAIVAVDATPAPAIVERLRGARFGLFTALARPQRLVDALARVGLAPEVTVAVADHGPVTPDALRRIGASSVGVWVATPKCAAHLGAFGEPVLVIDDDLALPAEVTQILGRIALRV